jgi:serine/threonine-protein kinase RsbT
MAVLNSESIPVRTEEDVVRVRHLARQWAIQAGFSLVDQTKLITAASELGRNTLVHGGGGTAEFAALNEGPRRGVRVTFIDHGPGIPDIEQALRDGFTSGGGLGLGLGGAKRLVNQFDLQSRVGEGTRVTIVRWK